MNSVDDISQGKTIERRRFLALAGAAGAAVLLVQSPSEAAACSKKTDCGEVKVSRKGGDIIVEVTDAKTTNVYGANSSARIGRGRFDETTTDVTGTATHSLGAKKGDVVDVVVVFDYRGVNCRIAVSGCTV